MTTVLDGTAGVMSSAKPNPVTCTPEAMIAFYGVRKLPKTAKLFPKACKPPDLAMEARYFGRQVLAPPGRNWQGRFADAGNLLTMVYSQKAVDAMITGRQRRKKKKTAPNDATPLLMDLPEELIEVPPKVTYQHLDRVLEKVHRPLSKNHLAVVEGRSVYPNMVFEVTAETELLVSGRSNAKVGQYMVDGEGRKWGQMFTVGWEERATCPRTCHHWRDCYTNNSPFMRRKHYDLKREDEILGFLQLEVERVLREVKEPYVYVRLHQSGDFPSEKYVYWWMKAIERHPRLKVFGYTHWPETSPIGEAVQNANNAYWHMGFRIFRSNSGHKKKGANTFASALQARRAGNMPCLEQVGKSPSCGECQMCLPGRESRGKMFTGSIGFIRHAVPQPPGQTEMEL